MNDGTILILEDEMLIALDVQGTLQAAGHDDVVVCNTIEQAQKVLENTTPRVAVLDVNLGQGQTSFGVAIQLVTLGCRVILLSGYSTATVNVPPELKSAPRLAKPFVERELLEAVAQMQDEAAASFASNQ